MSLEGLHIENYLTDGFGNNHSTSLILPIDSTAYITNNGNINDPDSTGAYLNQQLLPRAVRLKISVQNPGLQVGENGDWGFWSVCHDDISISGYTGVNMTAWADNEYPQNIHPTNPLRLTRYQPDIFGDGGTNVSTLASVSQPYAIPGDFWLSEMAIGPVTETFYDQDNNLVTLQYNGHAKRPYKSFSELDTLTMGDQNINDYITEYGANFDPDIDGEWNYIGDLIPSNDAEVLTWQSEWVQVQTDDGLYGYQLLEQIEGSFYSPTTGRTYVDPSQAANKMWHPAVEKVLMFDTLGKQDVNGYNPGAGMQNNEIDVFVIFKDLQQLQNTSTGPAAENAFKSQNLHPSNGFFSNPYGLTILSTFASGEGQYGGVDAGLVNVDFDGIPRWNRVAGHPPNDTTGGNGDDTLAGEGTVGTGTGVTVISGGDSEDEGSDGVGTTTTTAAPGAGSFSSGSEEEDEGGSGTSAISTVAGYGQ